MKSNSANAPYCFRYRNKPPQFMVESKYLLSYRELHRIARAIIRQHKDGLFKAWTLKNRFWYGNVYAKKTELIRAHPLPDPVTLDDSDKVVVSKGVLQPKL